MKRFIRIILLVFLVCSTTSCFTMMALASASSKAKARGDALGESDATMELITFQRVARYAALASTGRGDVVCVIADFGQYYDGLILDGRFIRKGTYSYTTTVGVNKTVLVYLYRPDKKSLNGYADDFVRSQKSIVAEEPSAFAL